MVTVPVFVFSRFPFSSEDWGYFRRVFERRREINCSSVRTYWLVAQVRILAGADWDWHLDTYRTRTTLDYRHRSHSDFPCLGG